MKANIDRSPDPRLEFELVLSQMSSSKFTFKLWCQCLKVEEAGDNQLYLDFPSQLAISACISISGGCHN